MARRSVDAARPFRLVKHRFSADGGRAVILARCARLAELPSCPIAAGGISWALSTALRARPTGDRR
jgi:hypothetical protein